MSQNTPGTLPQNPTRTAKALVLVAVLLAALTLLLLVISLSGLKTKPAWQKALPTPAFSASQACTALLKAETLFEAEIRPQLIEAGFGSSMDMMDLLGKDDDPPPLSQNLTRKLWTLRAFPEARNILLQGLLEANRPPHYRQERFFGFYDTLACVAQTILPDNALLSSPHDEKGDSADPFAVFTLDPALKSKIWPQPDAEANADQPADTSQDHADHAVRTALTKRFLAILAADMQQEEEKRLSQPAPQGQSAAPTNPLWTHDDFCDVASLALNTLYEQRNTPYFAPLAFAFLESGEGTPEARYRIIPLMVQKPGLPLAEYLAWAHVKNDLEDITRCVGRTPDYFGYAINSADDLGRALQRRLKERGTLLLGGTTGPGVSVEKTDAPFPERHDKEGNLYLLADMLYALKNAPGEELRYDLSRACPVFANAPLRHLENQPFLLPLDPERPEDAALLTWYREEAAGDGRLLLFAADGTPEAVARHLADLHLMWWPKSFEKQHQAGDEDRYLALMYIQSGSFMLGVLPYIKGEAASRFLGPIRAMWFLHQEIERDQWYEARPEPGLPRISPKVVPPTFLISREVDEAFNVTSSNRFIIQLSRRLLRQYPDPAMSFKEAFEYINALNEKLYNQGLELVAPREQAITLFWRFRKDDVATGILRTLFENQELPVWERLEDARRALGLLKEKQ